MNIERQNNDALLRRISELERIIERLRRRLEDVIQGNGSIIVHNSSLDIDESARISDLTRKITNIENRIEYIESITGSEEDEPEGAPVEQIRIGNYRIYAPGTTPYKSEVHNGNTLFLEYDSNEGLTTEPDWGTYPKEKWTP